MKTLKSFIEASHIEASLIRAVVKQCGGWSDFKEMADDVTNHGANAGFGGWIYYTDTIAFYKRQKKNILSLVESLADDCGENVYHMIANFNCLKISQDDVIKAIYTGKGDYVTDVQNALSWFAFEEVCHSYSDQ